MSNPAELALVEKALKSGLGGCVEWDIDVVDRVETDLARYGLTPADVQRILIQYLRSGGKVVQVKEDREPWIDRRDFWYKVIVPMPERFKKGLFIEIELFNSDHDLPEVRLVNAHAQV